MKPTTASLLLVLMMSMTAFVNAAAYDSSILTGSLQGSNDPTLIWSAPYTKAYKVLVYIGKEGTATNALYRVYPKGKAVGNDACFSTDALNPCSEIAINQTLYQNQWVQLTLNNLASTAWSFDKNLQGFVSLNTSQLGANETLSFTGNGVRFIPFVESAAIKLFPAIGYSKIANDGSLIAISIALGSNTTAWACTRDNVTGLIWEVKTDDGGVRDKNNLYSWYESISSGVTGYLNYGSCSGGISCDTNGYVQASNVRKLCGFTNWRLPTKTELMSLININQVPNINPTYFPNTVNSWFWSSTLAADNAANVDVVSFYDGTRTWYYKYNVGYIRLVRTAQ